MALHCSSIIKAFYVCSILSALNQIHPCQAELLKAKFTNLACLSLNHNLAIFDKCQLKAVRRQVSEISFKLRFLGNGVQKANRSNGYTRILPCITTNICEYLARPRGNLFLEAFLSLFLNKSNIRHRCPYNYVIVEGLRAGDPSVLIPFPQGEYMYKAELSFWDMDPGVIWKIFFKTLE